MIELKHNRSSVRIQLRQIPAILGSLSFVIIDDKEVIFAIPAVTHDTWVDQRALKLGTGVKFTDPEGFLVRQLDDLFDTLRLEASAVIEIQENDATLIDHNS